MTAIRKCATCKWWRGDRTGVGIGICELHKVFRNLYQKCTNFEKREENIGY